MADSRKFPLGEILSVTTGRLVSDIGGVYRICDYMTGVPNFTHQLPRVGRTVAPVILEQHPALAEVEVPEDLDSEAKVLAWLRPLEEQYGAELALTPLKEYEAPDAFEELAGMMRPDQQMVIVVADDDGGTP